MTEVITFAIAENVIINAINGRPSLINVMTAIQPGVSFIVFTAIQIHESIMTRSQLKVVIKGANNDIESSQYMDKLLPGELLAVFQLPPIPEGTSQISIELFLNNERILSKSLDVVTPDSAPLVRHRTLN